MNNSVSEMLLICSRYVSFVGLSRHVNTMTYDTFDIL